MNPSRIVLFANTEWYLYNFRLSLAKRLRADGHHLLLISPPGPYGAKLKDLGFDWRPVAMNRRSLNPLREAGLLASLTRLFRREQPDLVHGLTIKCAVYGSIAGRLAGIPARVNAVNGLGYVFTSDDPRARALRPIVRRLMQFAFGGRHARLVVQNPDDQAMFEDAGLVPPSHIRLIPGSGVDCTRFFPRTTARPDGAPLRVLLTGRLLGDKGVREFVEAARLLKDSGLRFQIAGDADPGNPAAIPEAEARAWQDEGLVELLGHVDDMPAALRAADIAVLPSYREGLPKSLIEAAACALPLVATDVPGCREVVTDGETGLLVAPRNGEALATAIARLAYDPDFAWRLGQAARKRALAKFDQEIIVDRTLEVYREIV